jgi:hypothetical protein
MIHCIKRLKLDSYWELNSLYVVVRVNIFFRLLKQTNSLNYDETYLTPTLN